MDKTGPLENATLAALRIVAGLGYFSHGAQKLFGWFGGFGPDGGTADLMTRFGAAGVIEVVCGTAIILGLFTRPLAFLASGQMAVAYFWAHVAGRGSLWWWANGGELAMVYSFLWLYIAARGPGSFSVDAWRTEIGTTGADDRPGPEPSRPAPSRPRRPQAGTSEREPASAGD